MLKKRERLTKAAFDRSFSLGKRIHTPYVQVIYHHSPAFHGAAVVGKKVYKAAVRRNRLRRQIYGVLYRYHKQHPFPGTVIVVAKPAIRTLSQRQVAPAVVEALRQIRW